MRNAESGYGTSVFHLARLRETACRRAFAINVINPLLSEDNYVISAAPEMARESF